MGWILRAWFMINFKSVKKLLHFSKCIYYYTFLFFFKKMMLQNNSASGHVKYSNNAASCWQKSVTSWTFFKCKHKNDQCQCLPWTGIEFMDAYVLTETEIKFEKSPI